MFVPHTVRPHVRRQIVPGHIALIVVIVEIGFVVVTTHTVEYSAEMVHFGDRVLERKHVGVNI